MLAPGQHQLKQRFLNLWRAAQRQLHQHQHLPLSPTVAAARRLPPPLLRASAMSGSGGAPKGGDDSAALSSAASAAMPFSSAAAAAGAAGPAAGEAAAAGVVAAKKALRREIGAALKALSADAMAEQSERAPPRSSMLFWRPPAQQIASLPTKPAVHHRNSAPPLSPHTHKTH